MKLDAITTQPVVESARFVLRPLRRSDAGLIEFYTKDERVARQTTTIPHPLRVDSLDAHRPIQPPPRAAHDEHRLAPLRPAKRGFMARLRAGQRIKESALLRGTDRRPRLKRRCLALVQRLPAVQLSGCAVP